MQTDQQIRTSILNSGDRFNPSIISAYQKAGGTLSNGAIPLLTAEFPKLPEGNKVAPVVTSKTADDHITKLGDIIKQANQDIQNAAQANGMNLQAKTQSEDAKKQQDVENKIEQDKAKKDNPSDILNALGAGKADDTQKGVVDSDKAQNEIDKQYLASVQQSIDSMNAGTYPLSASESAAVNNLSAQFTSTFQAAKDLMNNQIGGRTLLDAKSQIQMYSPQEAVSNMAKIISAGNMRIGEINSKLITAQNDLTQAFKDKDYKQATELYTKISNTIKERNDEIKSINDEVSAQRKEVIDAAEKQRDYEEKVREFNFNASEKLSEFMTNNALDEKKFKLDQAKLAHQLEVDSSGGIGNLDDAGLDMLARGYLTSGTLPSVGYGKSAVLMRTAIVNRAVKLSGGNSNVNPAVNKAMYDANRATYTQQTKNYVVADTAYRIFDKNGDLAITLAQGLNKTNSPVINQLTNSVINQTTGKGQLDSFKAVLTSLQMEYATIINVKGGGQGVVTDDDKKKAEKAIPNDISPKRLQEVLTNLKTEGRNVLDERQQTLDTLNKNIINSSTAFNEQTNDNPLKAQIITAQSEGHSPEEIVNTIISNPQYTDAIKKAKDAGYKDQEIIDYLSNQ